MGGVLTAEQKPNAATAFKVDLFAETTKSL